MKRNLILAGGAAAFLVVAGGAAFMFGSEQAGAAAENTAAAQAGPPPAAVATASAVGRELAPRSETPGSVVSTRDSLVAAATTGKIEWVADIGEEVEAGDVIARLEQADAVFQRDNAEAEMRRLAARADYQSALYKRFVDLGEDAGESEAALDEMRANRDEARQALAQARVAMRQAAVNLERTEVKAPFAGRIVSQESQIGEFAVPGTELIRLVDTRGLEVTARAPAGLARNIAPGAEIPIQNGAEVVQGTVRAIVPVGDALSRMLELRIELPSSDWYIGSAVRVQMPAARARRVTAVPRDALILRADRISVFTVNAEGVARQVDVETGAAEGDFIEVVGDIAPGDTVVIRGGERLRDGQSVTVTTLEGNPTA
ncbi:MAG: efflux RND transporter periplasmic adaptor subunit [Pseudomonadota bacterium]